MFIKRGADKKMNIAIASGKGGTGKTTISVALAEHIIKNGFSVVLADCDVEEPNTALFLDIEDRKTETVYVDIPHLNSIQCIGCGGCEKICKFSSIAMVNSLPLIFKELCHSCGGCVLMCPTGALTFEKVPVGFFEEAKDNSLFYLGGSLDPGKIQTTSIISYVKNKAKAIESDFRIFDSPPGTSCPFVETVKGCEHLILVTEPTPFGLNDLKLSVEAARAMDLDFSVIINKNDEDEKNNIIQKFCKEDGIPVIAEIPYSREIAVAYSTGNFKKIFAETYSNELTKISDYLKKKLIEKRTNERTGNYKR
jgi:MinD superfamily P-loop ATPase